jgi:hypothetical protein
MKWSFFSTRVFIGLRCRVGMKWSFFGGMKWSFIQYIEQYWEIPALTGSPEMWKKQRLLVRYAHLAWSQPCRAVDEKEPPRGPLFSRWRAERYGLNIPTGPKPEGIENRCCRSEILTTDRNSNQRGERPNGRRPRLSWNSRRYRPKATNAAPTRKGSSNPPERHF